MAAAFSERNLRSGLPHSFICVDPAFCNGADSHFCRACKVRQYDTQHGKKCAAVLRGAYRPCMSDGGGDTDSGYFAHGVLSVFFGGHFNRNLRSGLCGKHVFYTVVSGI